MDRRVSFISKHTHMSIVVAAKLFISNQAGFMHRKAWLLQLEEMVMNVSSASAVPRAACRDIDGNIQTSPSLYKH